MYICRYICIHTYIHYIQLISTQLTLNPKPYTQSPKLNQNKLNTRQVSAGRFVMDVKEEHQEALRLALRAQALFRRTKPTLNSAPIY